MGVHVRRRLDIERNVNLYNEKIIYCVEFQMQLFE
jgi:hypothetical protein